MANGEWRMISSLRHSSFELRQLPRSACHIVRHKRAVRLRDIEHRVSAGFDVEHRLGDDRRPHVVARAGQLGQRGEHVDLGQRFGRRLQSRGGGGDQLAEFDEQVEFELLSACPRP